MADTFCTRWFGLGVGFISTALPVFVGLFRATLLHQPGAPLHSTLSPQPCGERLEFTSHLSTDYNLKYLSLNKKTHNHIFYWLSRVSFIETGCS